MPVLIEDCELPALLKDRVYADFRNDFDAGLQKLLAVFEQEAESAANVAPEVASSAAPCSQKLAAITLADHRRRKLISEISPIRPSRMLVAQAVRQATLPKFRANARRRRKRG